MYGEIESPCQIPLEGLNQFRCLLFHVIAILGVSMQYMMLFVHFSGSPRLASVYLIKGHDRRS